MKHSEWIKRWWLITEKIQEHNRCASNCGRHVWILNIAIVTDIEHGPIADRFAWHCDRIIHTEHLVIQQAPEITHKANKLLRAIYFSCSTEMEWKREYCDCATPPLNKIVQETPKFGCLKWLFVKWRVRHGAVARNMQPYTYYTKYVLPCMHTAHGVVRRFKRWK